MIDSDPQLFEGLLLCNGEGGEYEIMVKDLRSLHEEESSVELLRNYMFNMPVAISDKVAKMIDEALAKRNQGTSAATSDAAISEQVSKILFGALTKQNEKRTTECDS